MAAITNPSGNWLNIEAWLYSAFLFSIKTRLRQLAVEDSGLFLNESEGKLLGLELMLLCFKHNTF